MRELEKIKSIFKEINRLLPRTLNQEQTIFGVGSQGYYENPTSDIFAFFLDHTQVHDLGTLVLEALIENLTEDNNKIQSELISPPEREVSTLKGNRIDLLLESEEWVMIIENKIYHDKINPFLDYENHINKRKNARFKDKKPIFVILSPDGTVPNDNNNWEGICYLDLIFSIKGKLAARFLSQPMNKWLIHLREFTLHLENLMTEPIISDESLHFVLNNHAQFEEVQKFKKNTLEQFRQNLLKQLYPKLPEEIKGLKAKLTYWYGGHPVFQFSFEHWSSASYVAVFFDSRPNKSPIISSHIDCNNNEDIRKRANKHFELLDEITPWDEEKNKYRCFGAYFDKNELENLPQQIIEKLLLTNKFETEIRYSKIDLAQ